MIRKIYIDGYNALRKVQRYSKLMKSDADAARRGFVESLRGKTGRNTHTVVVFDGAGEGISGGGPITVTFTFTRTADSWIRQAVEREPQPAAILVVSSDHEVQNHARVCGAQVQRSEDFMASAAIEEEPAGEKPEVRELGDDEVAMWMKLFSGQDNNTGKQ